MIEEDGKARADPENLHGLSLKEAFGRFVVECGDVKQASDRANEVRTGFRADIDGVIVLWRKGQWPLQFHASRAAADLCAPVRSGGPGWINPNAPVRTRPGKPIEWKLAYETIFDRYQEFVALLKGGRLVAVGRPTPGSEAVQIDAIAWSSSKDRLDLLESALVTRGGDRSWAPKFQLIQICAPALLEARKAPGAVTSLPSGSLVPAFDAGKKQTKYLWTEAFDRVLDRWLSEGEPASGAELCRWMDAAFMEMNASRPAEEDCARWVRQKFPRIWIRAKGVQS